MLRPVGRLWIACAGDGSRVLARDGAPSGSGQTSGGRDQIQGLQSLHAESLTTVNSGCPRSCHTVLSGKVSSSQGHHSPSFQERQAPASKSKSPIAPLVALMMLISLSHLSKCIRYNLVALSKPKKLKMESVRSLGKSIMLVRSFKLKLSKMFRSSRSFEIIAQDSTEYYLAAETLPERPFGSVRHMGRFAEAMRYRSMADTPTPRPYRLQRCLRVRVLQDEGLVSDSPYSDGVWRHRHASDRS